MKKHNEQEINRFIPEAKRMAEKAAKERKADYNQAFVAAMNRLTSEAGLRVLTADDKAFADMVYGD